jgi:plastocyanin
VLDDVEVTSAHGPGTGEPPVTRFLAPIRQRSRPTYVLGAIAVAAVLASCGSGSDAAAPAAEEATVEIQRSRFAPADVNATTGEVVEFTNLDPFDHTVTATADSPVDFDSGALGQDETFTQQFDEPGTYGYFCEIHPTMRGSIVVG